MFFSTSSSLFLLHSFFVMVCTYGNLPIGIYDAVVVIFFYFALFISGKIYTYQENGTIYIDG